MNPHTNHGPQNAGHSQTGPHPAAGPGPNPTPGPALASNAGDQPVAYDREGHPLYARAGEQPNLVYMAKPIDPIQQPISERVLAKHAESLRKYPYLNLSKGEYIISAVRRHPIGLVRIWFFSLVLIIAFMSLYATLFAGGDAAAAEVLGPNDGSLQTAASAALGFMIILITGGAFIATYVYNQNKFFLTNESVIQEIQTSLFAKHEQTVSLANIEDASFQQNGILPSIFNYATIRLSTEGDETTYRFSYVSSPKKQIAILNNAVEAFKNGRPVDPDES